MIQAIETAWRGYRFRSRTEARWAVMFTAAGEPFEYEREGYALPSGWYLPDFWLPDRKCWFEIKGEEPTPQEIRLACDLARHTKSWVLFGVGSPDHDVSEFQFADTDGNFLSYTTIYWPRSACNAARGERFDGKPPPTEKLRPMRW